MKKIILMVACAMISAGVFAQTTETTTTTTTKTVSTTSKTDSVKKVVPMGSYRCPHGDYTLPMANRCPNHKIALVKDGKYYCAHCDGITSDKAGKCTKCKMDMVKMMPPVQEIKPAEPVKHEPVNEEKQ